MNSDYLKEVFSELDTSSEHIQFLVSPSTPNFQIRTFGPAGDCNVDVPNTSDMVELFTSTATSTAKYKLAMLRHGIKPLTLSEKVRAPLNILKVYQSCHCLGEHQNG